MPTPEYPKPEGFDISLGEIIDKGVMVNPEAIEKFNDQAKASRIPSDGLEKLIDFLSKPNQRKGGVLSLENEKYVLVRVESEEQKVGDKDLKQGDKPEYRYQEGGHLYNIAPEGEHYRPISELVRNDGSRFELAIPGLQKPLSISPSYYVHVYAVPSSCFNEEVLRDKGWVY